MNQAQPYMDMHSAPHMSSAQSYGPHSATTGSLPQYPHYQQSSVLPTGSAHYSNQPSYASYQYTNGVTSPQSAHPNPGTVPSQVHATTVQLPAMMPPNPAPHSYVASSAPPATGYPSQQPFDTTGQIAPPGVKPRVTATLWEDEGSLCFQVEAKGVCVARREDNHFINGTKLLNVAGMTRGRRDGILKSEKTRHVVKIGPMHLKGVWIPFERALDFANKEKITDVLYPLFVHNIGGLLYTPENSGRTNAVVAATERRRMDTIDASRAGQGSQAPALHHHHSMQATVGSQVTPTQHSIAPHPGAGRPGMERAHTFPTPPTSASSVNNTGYQGGSASWPDQHLQNGLSSSHTLSIDTGLSNARSMPTTPATTPPGTSLQSLQPYQGQSNFDASKSYYSSQSTTQNGYTQPSSLDRFGQPLQPSFKSEMGPPSAPGILNDTDQHDTKGDGYGHVTANGHSHSGSADSDPANHHENGYMDNNASAYGANRSQYSYSSGRSHPHLSPEMTSSPSQQANSGRGTPRTLPPNQSQWTPEHQTPSRQSSTSNVYSVMGDPRTTNGMTNDTYNSAYATSVKRGRDDDDQDHGARPGSRELGAGFDPKRRKTNRQDTYGTPLGVPSHMQQAIKSGGGLPGQR